MSLETHPSGPSESGKLGLLALTPIIGAMLAGNAFAAAPKISASGKFDASGKLTVTGKASGVPAGTRIAVFDASNHFPLYSTTTDSKSKFDITVPADPSTLCKVLIEAGGVKAAFAVKGASSACGKAPTCAIDGGNQALAEGGSANFSIKAGKTSKKDPMTFTWTVSDAVPTMKTDGTHPNSGTGATFSHAFPHAGLYRVSLAGRNAGGACGDDVLVSVAPANAPAKVGEVAKASNAAALNAPDNGYVVLPFEETGMQGGSQIHLPYNPMIPYNSLNAQVIQKLPNKPKLQDSNLFDLFYSAASNANDPFGANSINSTSQNLFGDGQAGSNIDYANSTVNETTQIPTHNAFVAGHDFLDAVIRKSEQWDRPYQKNAAARGLDQTAYDFAWQQNRFTPAKPPANPDESIRGYVDMGEGVRKMPGAADPYHANDPQKFDFNAEQNAFVAQFIPASNIDDQGRVNPYPLMRVEAKKDGATVAKADAVYTTASETRCRECHLPGGIAANEDVWRTPVTEAELKLPDGSPGPATGAGNFDPGLDPGKAWPPAVHNRFDDKHPENPTFTNLTDKVEIPKDANGLRQDRVKASRWVKLDANGQPTAEVSDTKPEGPICAFNTDDPSQSLYPNCWTVQLKIKFKSGADYGDANDPMAQEKAALFNALVMHDYMVLYGPTPASGKTWPASYSTQLADAYSDDDVGKANTNPMYFCSGHHQSQLKFDIGITAKAPATNRSDYSRAFHAFHGKMQVYKQDVSAGLDGKAHAKGELIRDSRGHPLMYGGRGWDSQKDDDNGIPLKLQHDGTFADNTGLKGTDPTTWDSSKFTVPTWDPGKNNWRPDLWPKQAQGELMLQFGDKVAMEDNCVLCHTGKTEKSYRDIHHAAGLKCDSCHGDMLAVGNVYPNEGYDANLMWAGAFGKDTHNNYGSDPVQNMLNSEPADFRRPWIDEPDCGSCHIGDANIKEGEQVGHPGHSHALENVFSAGVLKQSWHEDDASMRSMDPFNARFAVMPVKEDRPEKATDHDGNSTYKPQPLSQALYRKSGDVHGSGANGLLTCSTCHGGSHAIWPNADPNANDNVTALQLQGYSGNIAECSVCHVKDDFKTGLVATTGPRSVAQGYREGTVVGPNAGGNAFLAGPHGMHPVNDEWWWKNADGVVTDDFKSKTGNGGWHSDMSYKPGPDGEDQCAACHGADHKGTRLSKTLTARTFISDKGKTIKVEAGQEIGCDLCHAMKVSFNRAPNPKAPDGGWPKPEMHAPPQPEAISPVSGDGGGHGGH